MNRTASSVEQAKAAFTEFVASSREPVLFEPGEEPLALTAASYALEVRGGHLTLEAWDEKRVFVRRITGLEESRTGRLQFRTERFGKRTGALLLVDRRAARSQSHDLRAAREAFAARFRLALRRQLPDWRIEALTTEPDLEHSLSPSFPRALLRKGAGALAAIGAPSESQDPAAALAFGLIWLDYLRQRERRLQVEGLLLFLPAGRERVACLRVGWLNPQAARYLVYVYTEDGYEDPVDLADYGNLDTRLAPAVSASPEQPTQVEQWTARLAAVEGVARVTCNDGSTSLRARGLEFARARGNEVFFGLETRRLMSASNVADAEKLGAELVRMRSADHPNRDNPLYARNPEGWLESQVRSSIRALDAALVPEPVYGQVPAFTAGDRDVIDLLAADSTGRLAVLELKASEDLQLPMQALDYWMRVRWHAAREEFGPAGYFPGTRLRTAAPRLLLIAPAFDFHPSNETVLRYFSPGIEVERIGVNLEWRKDLKVMFRY